MSGLEEVFDEVAARDKLKVCKEQIAAKQQQRATLQGEIEDLRASAYEIEGILSGIERRRVVQARREAKKQAPVQAALPEADDD